jgi:hypothetical protein
VLVTLPWRTVPYRTSLAAESLGGTTTAINFKVKGARMDLLSAFPAVTSPLPPNPPMFTGGVAVVGLASHNHEDIRYFLLGAVGRQPRARASHLMVETSHNPCRYHWKEAPRHCTSEAGAREGRSSLINTSELVF